MPDMPKSSLLQEGVGLIRAVKSDAEGAVLVLGLVLLLVTGVSQVGPWKFARGAPIAVTLVIGLFLTAGGIAWIVQGRRRIRGYLPDTLQGELPNFAYDNDFLLKAIIKGLPPVFIKEVTEEESSRHLLQSDALSQLQGLNDRIPIQLETIGDARRRDIRRDHRQSDEHALSLGRSRQVEFLDALAGQPLRTVLTTKTRVDHAGRTFVVGWAIPVGIPDGPARPTMCYSEDSGEVRHRLMPAEEGAGIDVDIAPTVLKRLRDMERKSRPRPGGHAGEQPTRSP